MKWKKWLENWDMTGLQIKTSFLEMEWKPQTADQDAAWELYIELLTRVTTQELQEGTGDEEEALQSIYIIFDLTREIIKKYKRDCMEFAKISVIILNQVLRPFTAKWHKLAIAGLTDNEKSCFREELRKLQETLHIYTQMLGDMAGVEKNLDLATIGDNN